jgi:hypothetical protein
VAATSTAATTAPVLAVPVAAHPSAAAPAVTTSPPTSTTPAKPVATPSTPPSGTTPATAAPAQCPIKLATPATSGGLQSLIDFAPAFGPFSAEAFAAASAYQPLLQLLGPILAQYPTISAKAGPAINALLGLWETILNSLYGLLAPIYAPYRQGVLNGETKFAAFLAPYSERLADSPLGGCIVDLEAALVHDTR